MKASFDAAIPPASGVARHGVTEMGATEGKAQNTGEVQSLKSAESFSQAGVPRSSTSLSSSSFKYEDEKDQAGGADSPKLEAVPADRVNGTTSNPPQPAVSGAAILPDPKQLRVGHETEVVSPEQTSNAAAKLEPFELPILRESTNAPILAVTPVIPALIKSASISVPDFVLDHTLKGHSGWVTGVAFSADGERLASGSWDQTVKFWDVPTGHEVSTVASKMKEVQALAFSHDGHWLAAENSSDTVTLWDAKTGREIRTLLSNKPLGVLGSNWVYSIAFSPDGRWLASGVDDKTVRLWDVRTGRAVRDLTALRRSVIYAAFSPDGRWLASGNDDKSIRIWEVSTGQEIARLSGHKKAIYAVAFSPNGHYLASAGADKTIKLWDITTGRELRTLTGHGSVVTSLAFSPDGGWLASGSWDKTVKIWDVETGRQVETLGGREHSIYSVAFDSRGRWLASGSEDGTINLWRLARTGDQTKLR
jgi:WD40 repeat protein